MAALDVDDAEPPVGQVSPRVVIEAEIIRAAMANRIGHAPQFQHVAKPLPEAGAMVTNPAMPHTSD